LEAELSRVKRMYKRATKGMTIEQQRETRSKSWGIRFLYYQKRIFQNYEEYSNYGKISEPLADSPLELMKDTMTNQSVLNKRQAKTQKALEPEPKQVTKAKTQRRRLSPNTIQEREIKENEKLLAKIIKKYKIDVSTKAGQDELYRLVLSLKEK
jgi:hypothetical protein